MIAQLKTLYQPIKTLSEKNGRVLHLRHRTLGKDLICRRYMRSVPAYEILKAVRHPNLPEIYDSFTVNAEQIILEEFIEGITVAEVLETGRYTPRGARKLLRKVCAAVAALHEFGIVHRDIKPENVMLTPAGDVKLIDLNASKCIETARSQTTQLLGTIGYAAYEQMGLAESDERTDIFALGVLLNVMLTGQHPTHTLAKGRMGRIVLKCTQIDPDSRYQSVEKLLKAL